jgi:GNAT superfamily N-acetyltransferase
VHERLAWMLRTGAPPAEAPGVDEVPFAATRDLRGRWHRGEAWAGDERAVLDFLDRQDEVAARRGERAFVVREAGRPIAFAALLTDVDAVEIEQVFVAPDRRGAGLGTRLIETALAAGDRDTAWIVADDDGRAKPLYERLGFAAVWLQHAFVRYPESRPPA